LRDLAADVGSWSADTPRRLDDTVNVLREHLVPHARAEEIVLYPAVEVTMDAPHATDTMVRDHAEIRRRVDRLGALAATVGASPPELPLAEELREQLYGLYAILRLHFLKEEEVLLPVIDAGMTHEQGEAMFADMAAVSSSR
jgi:iron-sulfur cluster repair protein YtfE (RIC family)